MQSAAATDTPTEEALINITTLAASKVNEIRDAEAIELNVSELEERIEACLAQMPDRELVAIQFEIQTAEDVMCFR